MKYVSMSGCRHPNNHEVTGVVWRPGAVALALFVLWLLLQPSRPNPAEGARTTRTMYMASCMAASSHREFCLLLHNTSDYASFIRSCSWTPVKDEVDVIWAWHSDHADDSSVLNPNRFPREKCHAGSWTAYKIGPFRTHGGMSWNGVAAMLTSGHLPEYRVSRLHAFTGYVVGNVDQHDRLLGYPPIHQHHFHFVGGAAWVPDDMNNHADSQCHADEGGADCLIRIAPSGFAWMLADRPWYFAEFNDVRYSNAPLLESWNLLAFQIASPKADVRQVRMAVLSFADPQLMISSPSPRIQYEVDTTRESIGWVKQRIDGVKDTLETYMHTHAIAVEDVWLFQGTPDMVFEVASEFSQAEEHVTYGADIIAATMHSIQRRQLQPNAARLACSYKRSSRREEVCYERHRCMTVDRVARCHLDPSVPDLLLVALHRKRAIHEPPFGLSPTYATDGKFRMHALVRVYYAGDRGLAVVARDSMLSRSKLVEYLRKHVDTHRDARSFLAISSAAPPETISF